MEASNEGDTSSIVKPELNKKDSIEETLICEIRQVSTLSMKQHTRYIF